MVMCINIENGNIEWNEDKATEIGNETETDSQLQTRRH